jgi:hypothetical protein
VTQKSTSQHFTSTSANEQSFNTYIKYLAIKRHFTTKSYNYHKYNGKVNANFENFRTRNDVYFFAKLSKKDDSVNRILSNVLVNPKVWIRDVVSDAGETHYNSWKKTVDSLGYSFKNELGQLDEDYKANYIVHDGQHPKLISLFLQKKLSLETFTILSHTANIFSYWEQNITDKFIAADIITLAKKYKPFLAYDDQRFNTLVKNHFDIK